MGQYILSQWAVWLYKKERHLKTFHKTQLVTCTLGRKIPGMCTALMSLLWHCNVHVGGFARLLVDTGQRELHDVI